MLPSAAGETDVTGRHGLACGRYAAGCRSDSRFRTELHATQGFYDKISKQGVSKTQSGGDGRSLSGPSCLPVAT